MTKYKAKFQSTHPSRDATYRARTDAKGFANFNPRIPRGMRRRASTIFPACSMPISIHASLAGCDTDCSIIRGRHEISIHASLAGCDAAKGNSLVFSVLFQSTHPSRDATTLTVDKIKYFQVDFNPRIPRGMRRDLPNTSMTPSRTNFNPRIPRGMRRP